MKRDKYKVSARVEKSQWGEGYELLIQVGPGHQVSPGTLSRGDLIRIKRAITDFLKETRETKDLHH